ncbi:prepilin-type N-terminal cleavage/methylation domain-containing protein [Shewanella marina]|uniref:prepilin-type N-terminal cleavage/methylation domain-containing protein n=1 Tax=Shewanella marina TaxID=487319 RepID=UPI000ADA9DF7
MIHKIAKNKGFTLIELVVVIIILGIIAVVAIPKFINLQQDAHEKTIKAVFGAFKSSVNLYHSCWLASGKDGFAKDLACYGQGNIDSSKTGYPLGVDTGVYGNEGTVLTGNDCETLWYGLLDNHYKLVAQSATSFAPGNDIVYWYQADKLYDEDDQPNPNAYCYYNYIADNPTIGSKNWQLQYFPATGQTKITQSVLTITK